MRNENIILNYINKNKSIYIKLAKDIWKHPQTGFKVDFASNKKTF